MSVFTQHTYWNQIIAEKCTNVWNLVACDQSGKDANEILERK